MRYTLTDPMIITARLAPGFRVGDYTFSVEPIAFSGRWDVMVAIDGPDGEIYSSQNCLSAPGHLRQEDVPREAASALCSFLAADAEKYSCGGPGDDGWIFNERVAEIASTLEMEFFEVEEQFAPQR